MPRVRRLAAILAADVARYSRLMGADEEGTHERLKAHRGELINPRIGDNRRRAFGQNCKNSIAAHGNLQLPGKKVRPEAL